MHFGYIPHNSAYGHGWFTCTVCIIYRVQLHSQVERTNRKYLRVFLLFLSLSPSFLPIATSISLSLSLHGFVSIMHSATCIASIQRRNVSQEKNIMEIVKNSTHEYNVKTSHGIWINGWCSQQQREIIHCEINSLRAQKKLLYRFCSHYIPPFCARTVFSRFRPRNVKNHLHSFASEGQRNDPTSDCLLGMSIAYRKWTSGVASIIAHSTTPSAHSCLSPPGARRIFSSVRLRL